MTTQSRTCSSSLQASSQWESSGTLFAAIWIAVAGSYAMSVLPLFIGSLAGGLQLNDQQMGWLASADLAGMALSSGSAIVWVRRINWRLATFVAFSLMLIANGLATQTSDFQQTLLLRALSGMGGGIAMAVGLSCQGDSSKADKLFGLFIACQVLTAIVSFLLMPKIQSLYGTNGVLGMILCVSLSGFLCIPMLPSRGKARPSAPTAKGKFLNFPLLLALGGILLFCMAMGGIWTYIQRIGLSMGLESAQVGQTLGIAALFGMLCALGSAYCSRKLGRPLALLLVTSANVTALLLLNSEGLLSFTLALCFFQMGWMIGLPLIMGLINSLDTSGKVIVITLLLVKVAYALAPLLLGALIFDGSFILMTLSAGGLCLLGALLCALATLSHRT